MLPGIIIFPPTQHQTFKYHRNLSKYFKLGPQPSAREVIPYSYIRMCPVPQEESNSLEPKDAMKASYSRGKQLLAGLTQLQDFSLNSFLRLVSGSYADYEPISSSTINPHF